MKRVALNRHEHFEIPFTTAELAFLREEKYSLSDKGDASFNNKNYQRFLPNYQFAFKAFAKAHGVSFSFAAPLHDLNKLESVRNRLTHPKGFLDLEVSDAEISLARRVLKAHSEDSDRILVVCTDETIQQQARAVSEQLLEKVREKIGIEKRIVLFLRDGSAFEFHSKKKSPWLRQKHSIRGEGI